MPHREITSFLEKLMERVHLDPNLPPNEVHVFNVHASFGHYQVIIGPAAKVLQRKREMAGNRALEINGAMHHLFVTKNHVTPHPSHRQIHNNLKGCIILRDLTVHIKDPTGKGIKVAKEQRDHAVECREKINLAGNDGEKFLKRMELTGRLAKDTYKIVQEDILNALANKQYTTG
ncbi:MAG: hypothetical protein HY466_02250 [Deltaproteobacteria bacterium]|nr:hypothetical protein [Deltaproteobacteria bacterium]